MKFIGFTIAANNKIAETLQQQKYCDIQLSD